MGHVALGHRDRGRSQEWYNRYPENHIRYSRNLLFLGRARSKMVGERL